MQKLQVGDVVCLSANIDKDKKSKWIGIVIEAANRSYDLYDLYVLWGHRAKPMGNYYYEVDKIENGTMKLDQIISHKIAKKNKVQLKVGDPVKNSVVNPQELMGIVTNINHAEDKWIQPIEVLDTQTGAKDYFYWSEVEKIG